MTTQEAIDLMRVKLDAARAARHGEISEEVYVSIHNVGATVTGEARLLAPGRAIPSDVAFVGGSVAELKPRRANGSKSARRRGK